MTTSTNPVPTCSWLVSVPTASLYPPEAEWYPDSPSDVYTEVECGATLTPVDGSFDNGWACEAGHHHYTYGSVRQQADEAVDAEAERYGMPR